MSKLKFVLPLALLLVGCVTQPTIVAPGHVECIHPEELSRFTYEGFAEYKMNDDTLVLTTGDERVIYQLRPGTACKIDYNNEQGETFER